MAGSGGHINRVASVATAYLRLRGATMRVVLLHGEALPSVAPIRWMDCLGGEIMAESDRVGWRSREFMLDPGVKAGSRHCKEGLKGCNCCAVAY